MLVPQIPINTANRIISVTGKVFYNDRRRRIDIKKPIRDLFDSGRLEVYYTMELCLSQKRALERLEQLAKENIMPVFIYFTRKGEQQ